LNMASSISNGTPCGEIINACYKGEMNGIIYFVWFVHRLESAPQPTKTISIASRVFVFWGNTSHQFKSN